MLGVTAGACVAGLAWLWRAEIDATWLASAIEEEIEAGVPGLSVSLGEIRARNLPWRDSVRVDVRGAVIRYRDRLAGRVDRLVVEIDHDSLLRAAPRLKRLRVRDVALDARWSRAEVEALLRTPGDGALPVMPWVDGLESLVLDDIAVHFTETESGVRHRFRLNAGRIEAHDPGTLKVKAIAHLTGPESGAALRIEGSAVPHGAWAFQTTLVADGLTGLAGPVHPALAGRRLDVPLRIEADIRADKVISVAANVSAERGRVALPEFWARPVDVARLSARLVWDGAAQAARLEQLAGTIGGVTVEEGAAAWRDDAYSVTLRLGPISARKLRELWPKGVVEGGRAWVVRNVSGGVVPRLDLALARAPEGDEKVDLSFDFSNLTVHYRRPMPPVVRGTGKARLIGDTLRFEIRQGEINGIDMAGSVVRLEALASKDDAEAVVETRGRGAIYQLLQVLDSEPLGYITAFGLKPTDVGGLMTMEGVLTVPLRASVGLDDVDFNATAQGVNVSLPDVLNGHGLVGGRVTVTADRHGLEAQGTAMVGPQFAHILWHENFEPNGQPSSRYHIRASTDGGRLTRLGYDGVGALVEGPIDLTLDLVGRGQAIEGGTIRASLDRSTIDLRKLGILKRPGEAATATFDLVRSGDLYQVKDLVVRADRYHATGRGVLDPQRGSRHWFLDRLHTPAYVAAADIVDTDGQPMRLAIRGDTLDLKPMLDIVLAPGPGEGEGEGSAGGAAAESIWPDMVGGGSFRAVRLYNGQWVDGAALSFETKDNLLAALNFTGKLNGASALSAQVTTQGARRRFRLEAAQAGELAHALDFYANGAGGTLTVEGEMRGTGPTLEIDGVARMKDFRLVEAPVLAKILGFASLTGLADTLSGRGIRFETAKVPFTLRKGIFTIKDGRVIGPALGITVEGQVQKSLGKVHLKGVVVPSYTVNSLIGKIPLLGPLVVGGKHEGLIGFNYRVEGALRDPDITVNGASGLTPGFLRLFLSGAPATVEDEEATPAPAAGGTSGN